VTTAVLMKGDERALGGVWLVEIRLMADDYGSV
jgi:hypothetical protein